MSSDLDCLFKNLKKINKHLADGSIYLFRGHQDSSYLIQPSVFRENKKTEYEIFSYIMTKHYDEFVGMKPLEVLAKMQHLGVATRLLDLTQNPLVGLFFVADSLDANDKSEDTNSSSVSGKPEEKKENCNNYGELLVFEYEDKDLKKYDSDTVKLLSCLPFLKEEDKKQLLADAVNEYLIQAYVESAINSSCAKGKLGQLLVRIIADELKSFYYLDSEYGTANGIGFVFSNIDGKIKKRGDSLYRVRKREFTNSEFDIEMDFEYQKNNLHSFLCFDISCIKINFFITLTPSDDLKMEQTLMMVFSFKKEKDEYPITFLDCIALEDGICPREKMGKSGKSKKLNLYAYVINNLEEDAMAFKDNSSLYKSKVMEELYYKVQGFYPEFRRCAKSLDIINGAFVCPIVNTDRMRAQQGLFAIYGLSQYWNFKNYLAFHAEEGTCFYEAVRQFLDNKTTSNNDDKTSSNENDKKTSNKAFKEMEESIYGVKRIPINTNSFPELRRSLRKLGIDKESLGCSIETTYKKLIES